MIDKMIDIYIWHVYIFFSLLGGYCVQIGAEKLLLYISVLRSMLKRQKKKKGFKNFV